MGGLRGEGVLIKAKCSIEKSSPFKNKILILKWVTGRSPPPAGLGTEGPLFRRVVNGMERAKAPLSLWVGSGAKGPQVHP
jgi:hypothetical protein